MPDTLYEEQLAQMTRLAQEAGAKVSGAISVDQRIIVDFGHTCFAYASYPLPQPVKLQWYSDRRLNPQVFDSVNKEHGRRATLVADDFTTLLGRLPAVFEAIRNGRAFAS